MRRVLCVWLPHWPLQRRLHARPELERIPVVLYQAERQGLRVHSCSRLAGQRGVVAGMPVAEARGLFAAAEDSEGPLFELNVPRDNRQALERWALACHHFSPLVSLDAGEEAEDVYLDVTGCAHLFQGEAGLIAELVKFFGQRRWRVRVGLADTAAAAWAAAHFGRRSEAAWILPPKQQVQALHNAPVEALRLDAATLQTLRELEIDTLGRLQTVPRASWPSRLGARVVQQWEQLCGLRPENLPPLAAPPRAETVQAFEYPVRQRAPLELVIRQLLDRLLRQLAPRQEGICRLRVTLIDEAGRPIDQEVGFVRPVDQAEHVAQMLHTRMQQQVLPAGVSEIRLAALATARLDVRQTSLFSDAAAREQQRQFAHLVEQLSSRLGERAVCVPRLVPDAQPERAVRWQPLLGDALAAPGELPSDWFNYFAARPVCLKAQPQPLTVLAAVTGGPPVCFRWQGRQYRVRQSWGPERIETGWWRGEPVQRDYFRIETEEGQQFWVFRGGDHTWFLHGMFA